MKKLLLIAAITLASCSKDDQTGQGDNKPVKTEMEISHSQGPNIGSVLIKINNVSFGNPSPGKRFPLNENDTIEINGKPRDVDMWLEVRVGWKPIIKDTIRLGDSLYFKKVITKQYLDSIGAFTWTI